LRRFSAAYHISYPMLSDSGSVVIRDFGILNTNVPPDVTRFLRSLLNVICVPVASF
jgi:hypothetical protein